MKNQRTLLIFGATEYAQVAHYYFTRDAARHVAAFVVDDAFVGADAAPGPAPVIAWSEALTRFGPADHDVFVAIGYSGLNRRRIEKAAAMSQAGYGLASFLHTRAIAWDGFELRENCFILEHNTLQPFVQVGRDVVMWSGNHVGHHSIIEDGCFITSHVVIAGSVSVGAESFVGINALVRDHIRIGRRNVIGAGATILADTPDEAVFASAGTPMSKVPSSRLRRI
jgi:sugar O-acyltransferase (sialic acid O-acetyltransferase NeuD family)